MSDSAGLGGVGRERAAGAAESVVERDGGGEREEALTEADSEAVEGAGAVAFEAEQVLAGPEDALDALADRGQVRSVAGLVLAGWADDVGVERLNGRGELAADLALVVDHDLAAGAAAAGEHFVGDVAFVALGRRERERAWRAVEREQAVQPEAPEVAAVA